MRCLMIALIAVSTSICAEDRVDDGLLAVLDGAKNKPVRERITLVQKYFTEHGGITEETMAQIVAVDMLYRLRLDILEKEKIAIKARTVAELLKSKIINSEPAAKSDENQEALLRQQEERLAEELKKSKGSPLPAKSP